jgi:hypothetical protein
MSRSGATGVMDDQTGLDPDEAGLVWPDDRRAAVPGGERRLALASPGAAAVQDDRADEDDPQDAWSWTTDDASPGADAEGEGPAAEDEAGTVHQFPTQGGTR